MNDINLEELVKYFHAMWDNFPGYARLIDNRHKIIASNFRLVLMRRSYV